MELYRGESGYGKRRGGMGRKRAKIDSGNRGGARISWVKRNWNEGGGEGGERS